MNLNTEAGAVVIGCAFADTTPLTYVDNFKALIEGFGSNFNLSLLTFDYDESGRNLKSHQVLDKAVDLMIERSSNVVQPAKKYLFLVTAGVLSPSVAHSDLNVASSHTCTDCFAFDKVIDRLRKNQIELIVSGDKDEVTRVDWGFNTRITHLTGGIFVPLKHLGKFLLKFVDNVNSGAFNLRQILTQVENEGVYDNSQSNVSIVQRSAHIPIRYPSLINQQDETVIVGRPDAERILYGFSPWK